MRGRCSCGGPRGDEMQFWKLGGGRFGEGGGVFHSLHDGGEADASLGGAHGAKGYGDDGKEAGGIVGMLGEGAADLVEGHDFVTAAAVDAQQDGGPDGHEGVELSA